MSRLLTLLLSRRAQYAVTTAACLLLILVGLLGRSSAVERAMAASPLDGCDALAAEFDAALRAHAACARDADRACYPDLRIDGRLAVTDRYTAARVSALSDRYRRQQCPTIFTDSAGPVKCRPRCDAGVCRE
jgi:hypothetical protein